MFSQGRLGSQTMSIFIRDSSPTTSAFTIALSDIETRLIGIKLESAAGVFHATAPSTL